MLQLELAILLSTCHYVHTTGDQDQTNKSVERKSQILVTHFQTKRGENELKVLICIALTEDIKQQ